MLSCLSRDTHCADEAAAPKPSILAQRFRTKLCNKFATTGSCPYVHRCMFAHGKDELRTTAQNVADGLVNETSIRKYKRAQYEARKRAARNAKRALVASAATPTLPPAAPAMTVTNPAAAYPLHPMPAAAAATSTVVGVAGRLGGSFTHIPSAASLLALSHTDDGGDGDRTPSLYGAGASDTDALSDSGNASRRPFTTGLLRYRHDPYSVDCPLRTSAVVIARTNRRPLPAALVSPRRSTTPSSEASSD